MALTQIKPLVVIACGGTGGHLFPGLAVADQLQAAGCDVMAIISPKEVDQKGIQGAEGIAIKVLPAVGLMGRKYLAFLRGFWKSYRMAVALFQARPPHAVLAMGGFTSAPPVHAGRKFNAATFLHESNTIPGRANRWLARFVHQAFVGFPSAANKLRHPRVQHTGTPVRPQFRPKDKAAARKALGLERERDVLLVMGGSQGASGINQVIQQSLPRLKTELPGWQFLHLTGELDFETVRTAYQHHGLTAVVHRFHSEMDQVLAAATVAVSRAGASSLAELAAMQLPAILIPYPTAADNHQYYNARAFADAGAALLLDQKQASPDTLWARLREMAVDPAARMRMSDAVFRWHKPAAAAQIAENMLRLMRNLHGENFILGPVRSGPFSTTKTVVA